MYDLSQTPTITSISSRVFTPGDKITIYGSRFGTSTPVVILSNFILPILSHNDTQIIAEIPVDFPALINSSIYLRIPPFGNAEFIDPKDQFVNISLVLKSFSPTSGPISGVLLTLSGYGFTKETSVLIDNDYCLIRSALPREITCLARRSGKIAVHDKFQIADSSLPFILTLDKISGPIVSSVSLKE